LTARSPGPERLFTVRIEEDGASLAVHATGELDIATAQTLEETLRHALDGDVASIVLDVAEVSFIDSWGLRVLLRAAAHSRENGDVLRIRCGSGVVRRMLDVTGMEARLPLTA